jgi:hypothetical protein
MCQPDRHECNQYQMVRLYYAGAFGVLRVISVATDGLNTDFLRLEVKKPDGTQALVIAHASQCAFMFSITPRGDEREPVI